MLKIGAHLSASGGYEAMGRDALKIGANTFQFFTRNPRGSRARDMDPEDGERLKEIMEENNFAKILAHAPYTLNPSSVKESVREFTKMIMEDDLNRMEYFPGNYYNFHPGSHVGQGIDRGTELIVELLNGILKPGQSTMVLLETMSGKGTQIGRTFEELARIMEGVHLSHKVGICLDTCHIYDGGYDIVNDLDGVLEEFDRVIGLERLHAIHLNDSKNPFNSRKDRHEKIGEGTLGSKAIIRVINHPKLRHLPFFLETPNELDGYAREIKMLRDNFIWEEER